MIGPYPPWLAALASPLARYCAQSYLDCVPEAVHARPEALLAQTALAIMRAEPPASADPFLEEMTTHSDTIRMAVAQMILREIARLGSRTEVPSTLAG